MYHQVHLSTELEKIQVFTYSGTFLQHSSMYFDLIKNIPDLQGNYLDLDL